MTLTDEFTKHGVPSPPTSICIIIPAFNEEESISLVLRGIPGNLAREIVVVDNGSTDATARIAAAEGATVLTETRRGYGSACLAGLAYLRSRPPDIVVFLDGDFSDHPDEMVRLLTPIQEEGFDLVIGSRTLGRAEAGALLPQARLGNRLATFLLRALYGVRYTDLGPFRAARYGPLMELGMKDTDFGWTVEMQARAALAGWRSMEVPVSYRRRVGVSKITGTVSGTIRAGIKILTTLFLLRLGRTTGKVLESGE
jgi:glycosyltransferase involved in cell wall biosynthesis